VVSLYIRSSSALRSFERGSALGWFGSFGMTVANGPHINRQIVLLQVCCDQAFPPVVYTTTPNHMHMILFR
jgi:hypothetical protein